MTELKRLGNIYGAQFGTGYAGNVWSQDGLCPTIKCESEGGGRVPMVVVDAWSVASRGRNPDNPSDRTAGAYLEQRLEVNKEKTSNCLTSAQKDYMVMEQDVRMVQNPHGFNKGGVHSIAPTLTSNSYQENNFLISNYRIRKLTPKEMWRVMSFSDEDFDKAKQVNSDTQLIKQAGNAIVKNVLMAIFGQMFDGKDNAYKYA